MRSSDTTLGRQYETVGKTALLRHWASQSGIATTYWVAERELPTYQRRRFYARLLGVPLEQAPIFETWPDLWLSVAQMLDGRSHVIILDELPYAMESDPAVLSALQHAWDQHFQHSQVRIFLCGSQVHTMETMLAGSSPLFGRMTGQWLLRPLPFGTLPTFLPHWSAEELVATYAIVGGIPAYLEWLQPERGLVGNLRDVILAPGSMFLSEPTLILSDEIRDPRVHRTIVQAIGRGAHTLNEISAASFVSKTHLRRISSGSRSCGWSSAGCPRRCRRPSSSARARGATTSAIPSSASTSASSRRCRTT